MAEQWLTDQLLNLGRQYFRHIHLISYFVLYWISNWIRYKRCILTR